MVIQDERHHANYNTKLAMCLYYSYWKHNS